MCYLCVGMQVTIVYHSMQHLGLLNGLLPGSGVALVGVIIIGEQPHTLRVMVFQPVSSTMEGRG